MTIRLVRLGWTLIALMLSTHISFASLVHYYTFDGDTLDDPTTHDSGGRPLLDGERTPDLTLTHGRTENPGDQALLFEGVSPNDPVYVDFDQYDFTDNFTIAAWVRPNPEPAEILTIVANKMGGNTDGFAFHINNWQNKTHGNLHFEDANSNQLRDDANTPGDIVKTDGETWQHVAIAIDRPNKEARFYYQGEELTQGVDTRIRDDFGVNRTWRIGSFTRDNGFVTFHGAMDEVAIWDETLTPDQVKNAYDFGAPAYNGAVPRPLTAGDANMDLQFDQLDLVQVQIAAKYLTVEPVTWGEGDWDGAPGGSPDNPPLGDGLFDQLDIIFALASEVYLTGPYAAIHPGGNKGDSQTSIIYNAGTGEIAVDAPAGVELTSINFDSAASIFTGSEAQNLGGSFDNDAGGNIFKATFGGSFGSLNFGNVAQTGLSEEFVLGDLSVVGSLAGGGDLGNVDLVYVPEPVSAALLAIGLVIGLTRIRHARH